MKTGRLRLLRPTIPLLAVALGAVFDPLRSVAQEPTIEELQKSLEERDRIINDLVKRVEALERTVSSAPKPSTEASKASQAPAQPETAVPPTTSEAEPESRPEGPATLSPEGEEQAATALELTLVQRGALLLPVWDAEIEPSVAYEHDSLDAVVLLPEGQIGTRTRSGTLDPAITFRLGLPWESQAEIRVPGSYARAESVVNGIRDVDESVGLGDVQLTLSRQVLREEGWIPDLLASAVWQAPTGSDPFDIEPDGVALGSGFHEITGRLIAVKTRDPLAFFGSLFYTATLTDDKSIGRINPGDKVGFSFGTVLAVSPETSLTFSFNQQFTDELSLDGAEIPGTDQTTATLQIGAAVLVTPTTLLNVTAGVGLTEDSPDFQIIVTVPTRFSF